MYQMWAARPPLIKPSVNPDGALNNVYYARPRSDYLLGASAITMK
jgi:hypothetical protein